MISIYFILFYYVTSFKLIFLGFFYEIFQHGDLHTHECHMERKQRKDRRLSKDRLIPFSKETRRLPKREYESRVTPHHGNLSSIMGTETAWKR